MSFEVYIIILVLFMVIYFLSKWILNRLKIGSNKKRKFIAVIPAAILSPIVYIGVIVIWVFSASCYSKEKFDEAKWHADTEVRYVMSEDIIESKMLIGKTKDEVILLLGKDYYQYNENHVSYYIGFVPGFIKIDPDVLDIYFENDAVTKVGQHET